MEEECKQLKFKCPHCGCAVLLVGERCTEYRPVDNITSYRDNSVYIGYESFYCEPTDQVYYVYDDNHWYDCAECKQGWWRSLDDVKQDGGLIESEDNAEEED